MHTTLAQRVTPLGNSTLRNILLAVAGSLVIAVAAQVTVPLPVVPITLQTLAVLAVGAAYGARLGAATLALYAVEGAAGLPVFAQFKAGPAVIAGPTGGYILGFILAAALVGYLAEKGWDRSLPKMFLAAMLGAVVLYVPGLVWLHQFANGWAQTLEWGLTPFLLGDLVKAALAALGFQAAWGLVDRKG
ncbi:MAG: biotin transporter BioY [Alphaproteobacteria bacterium]|nr:biotin transporter BioY [Alphaproteobacteria bacterium]